MQASDIKSFLDGYTERQSQILRWMRSEGYRRQFSRALSIVENDVMHGGKTLFAFGNGGSSANADHAALDFTKSTFYLQVPRSVRFKCVSLASNSGFMSACCNDLGSDTAFVDMLRSMTGPDSAAVLAMSVSGTSPNVRKLMTYASDFGMPVILLTGNGNTKWGGCQSYESYRNRAGSGSSVVHIQFPSSFYGVVEDAHMTFCHQLLEAVVTSIQGNINGFKLSSNYE